MLTEQQIVDAVTSKLPKRGCPACGSKEWEISSSIFISSVYSVEKGRIDCSQGAPMAVAICRKCGLFLQYGAARLGLLDSN